MKKPIYVTQPSLPDLDDFAMAMGQIWESKVLSNNGAFHQRLESELCEYLKVPYISLFNNGTNALIMALKAMNLNKGQVITTPYTFVATSHAIIWNHLKPVFVDIDNKSPNMCIKAVEQAITSDTVAILAVHCYGIPCNVEALQDIANKYRLSLVYDAAHAFAVEYKDKSILNFGDLSVLSFHATKVFNTFEGGAIICHSLEMKKHIDSLKNFGFNESLDVTDFGFNGKMNEIQALMGLFQLKNIDENLSKRKEVDALYRSLLKNIEGVECVERAAISKDNYSYFPIVINKSYSLTRDELYNKLIGKNIIARKYFYPLITNMTAYSEHRSETPNAERLAENVICLPIYSELMEEEVEYIVGVINN